MFITRLPDAYLTMVPVTTKTVGGDLAQLGVDAHTGNKNPVAEVKIPISNKGDPLRLLAGILIEERFQLPQGESVISLSCDSYIP